MTSRRKKEAMRKAMEANDVEAQKRIFRWSPGGYIPGRDRVLRRARRACEKMFHLMGRFKNRKGEDFCEELYIAECPRCKRWCIANIDSGELWGTALNTECK